MTDTVEHNKMRVCVCVCVLYSACCLTIYIYLESVCLIDKVLK